jgi:hypothetical protein
MKADLKRHLLLTLPFLVCTWLYASVIHMPFYNDDIQTFTYLSHVTAQEIIARADVTGVYYRPIVNLLYITLPLSIPQWHWLLLLNHLINVALVGAVLRALRQPISLTLMAMTIFAVFPLSTQAVYWVLSWVHPLITCCILIILYSGLKIMAGAPWWWWLSLGAFALINPFVHESGVLAGGLLVLLWLVRWGVRGLIQRWKTALLVLLLLAVGALLYLMVRSQLVTTSSGLNPAQAMLENLLYFLQGLTFPAQFIAALSPRGQGQPLLLFGLALLLFGIIAVMLLRRTRRHWNIALIGLAWWVLAILPSVLLLHPGYVRYGERLHYLSAVGIAVFFGAALAGQRTWRRVFIFTVTLIIAVSISRSYSTLYLANSNAFQSLFRQLDEANGSRMLVINLPQHLERAPLLFPFTRVHASFVPYAGMLEDFNVLNTGKSYENIHTAAVPDRFTDWTGYVNVLHYGGIVQQQALSPLLQTYDRVVLFRAFGGEMLAALIGQALPASTPVRRPFWRYDDVVQFEGMQAELYGNEFERVRLRWRKLTDETVPYVAFIHLICNETIVDQVDTGPLNDLYPFAQWQVGEAWDDYRYLRHYDTPQSCLRLRVGLYNRENGQRAIITTEKGDWAGVEWLTLPIIPE